MKPKNKPRKVQAQRKFAQGAFVPPSTSVPERRREVVPKEDNRFAQNTMVKMPARNLLDVVSFKSMHSHLQPIVLLKRLPESAEAAQRPSIKDKPPETNSDDTSVTPAAFKSQRGTRPKHMPLRARGKIVHTMKLRSRQQLAKKRLKNKRKNTEPLTNPAKRRRVALPSIGEFSVDDYKPLTYFTKKLPDPPTSPKSTSTSPKTQRPPNPISPKTPVSSPTPNITRTTTTMEPPPPRSRTESPSEELLAAMSSAIHKGVISVADLLKFSCGKTNNINKNLIDNGLSPIDQNQASTLLTRLNGPYYSSSQIARWVDACRIQITPTRNEIAKEMFKAPLPPPPSLLNKRLERPSLDFIAKGCDINDDVSSVCSFLDAPSCPSGKYITVKDVLEAPAHEMAARCKRCKPCSRVDKVHKIATLVKTPYTIDSNNLIDDIYEFRANDDMAAEPRLKRYRGGTRQAGRATNTTTTSNSDPRDIPLYLDILPVNSPHIIQIMSDTNNSKIMRARLIPKNQATSANQLSLVEHENLLDQLMITLRASNYEVGETNATTSGTTVTTSMANAAPAIHATTISSDEPVPSTSSQSPASLTTRTQPEKPTNNQEFATQLSTPRRKNLRKTPRSLKKRVASEARGNANSRNESSNRNNTSAADEPSTSSSAVSHRARSETPMTIIAEQVCAASTPNERETRSSDSRPSTSKNTFPKCVDDAQLVNAPVFYPTEAEFMDPIAYFEKIMPIASKFGLCKIVAPDGFDPPCYTSEDIRFNVMNQYVSRMYGRWGPAAREMAAIKAYLSSQSVVFTRAPLLDCMEVDLPKLLHMVQHNGGLKMVIEKKRWARVAEELRNSRCLSPGKKLDFIYVKYLLPYGTLSNQERQDMMRKVERCWFKKNQKMLDRAMNPLHRQKKLLGESDSSADEEEEEDENITLALMEAEDCIVLGRHMNLAMFKRTAANMMTVQFPPTAIPPTVSEVEADYWKLVLLGTSHVCVNSASIDTGTEGYGFTKNKNDPYGKHPWNLKVLSQNPGNVLRSMGPVLGVTVPTLHLGMLYTTSCWHRDPHGLPWIEYMHAGPGKIWYGIPDEQSDNFRKAVEKLCPTSCQNKSIWLPSDITMIPPSLLRENNVSLSRVTQEPGQFIIVFPKAYSCSISTGYTETESVYFATSSWLSSVHHIFEEVRESCEPTMFSLEQLLVSVARDPRVSLAVLQQVQLHLNFIVEDELANRATLASKGFKMTNAEPRPRKQQPRRRAGAWNVREQDECEICRATLYFSKVTNLTGKKTCVCLSHALQLIDLPKNKDLEKNTIEVVQMLPDSELRNILANVQAKLMA